MATIYDQRTHEKLTSDFIERRVEVDESLVDIEARLEELEACDKILRSFAAFGAGLLAARLAIGITRLAFGLDKKSNLRFALLVYNKWAAVEKGWLNRAK